MGRPRNPPEPSVQDAAALMLAEVDAAHAEKDFTRLTAETKLLIAQLAASGDKTQAQIADFVGVNQSTVSRVLSDCKDTTSAAKEFLQAQLRKMAEHVVKDGDPDL